MVVVALTAMVVVVAGVVVVVASSRFDGSPDEDASETWAAHAPASSRVATVIVRTRCTGAL